MRWSSCLHDVEWTTTGSSGYHLRTSSTTSPGLASMGSPTRSESAWIGFIQKSEPSLRPTGKTSRVWATNCGDHAMLEMGGPIASTSGSSRDLPLRAMHVGGAGPSFDDPPDCAHLGGRHLELVRLAPMRAHHLDQLGLRSAHHVPTAARDFHQHAGNTPPA